MASRSPLTTAPESSHDQRHAVQVDYTGLIMSLVSRSPADGLLAVETSSREHQQPDHGEPEPKHCRGARRRMSSFVASARPGSGAADGRSLLQMRPPNRARVYTVLHGKGYIQGAYPAC